MNLEELKQLYPTGFVSEEDTSDPRYLSVQFEDNKYFIPSIDINSREKALLSKIFGDNFSLQDATYKRFWQKFLWKQTEKTPTNGMYRIIQFKLILKDDSISKEDWLTTIKKSFYSIEDAFFTQPLCGLIIERKTDNALSHHDIYSLIEILDSDFYTQTKLFIGNFWADINTLPDCFKEEQFLFNKTIDYMNSSSFENLPESALNYLIYNLPISNSVIISQIKIIFEELKWAKSLIQTLWSCQNNISTTSQKLFLHRNTTLYRMDKFDERTGLQLRNNSDLLFCYIISLI